MAMSLKDFRQLEKMMTQTTSANDAEALVALRMANGLLAKYSYTWAEAFARLVKVDAGLPDVEDGADSLPQDETQHVNRRAQAQHARRGEIEAAFKTLAEIKNKSQGFGGFVDSLYHQWQTRGSLSEKQIAILLDAAAKRRDR